MSSIAWSQLVMLQFSVSSTLSSKCLHLFLRVPTISWVRLQGLAGLCHSSNRSDPQRVKAIKSTAVTTLCRWTNFYPLLNWWFSFCIRQDARAGRISMLDASQDLPMYECGPACKCNPQLCLNRSSQKGVQFKVIIRKTSKV